MASASEAPPFWWDKPDWRAWSLAPAAGLYGLAASARMAWGRRDEVAAAVLCVGNLTVGGEGKTPVCIALAREAKRRKLKVGFLTRGYGGNMAHPHLVDVKHDSARVVGDEPLLLARHAPTMVASNRVAGAVELILGGCNFIIMDDGFQSARLHMDYALIVVDAARGLGNGHVIPAGPLRAPLVDQLRYTDGVLTMGEGSGAEMVIRRASRAGRPVYSARLKPMAPLRFKGRRVLAFAGIGNPEKFYATLRSVGADVVATRSFPDHYPFSEEDLAELAAHARKDDLDLVTTEKDLVRLQHGSKPLQDFSLAVRALAVETVFETGAIPSKIIDDTLEAWRERMLQD